MNNKSVVMQFIAANLKEHDEIMLEINGGAWMAYLYVEVRWGKPIVLP